MCENRPDLIIHDSGGFESGGDDEFQQVKEFVNGMSSAREMKDRLHVIWCAMFQAGQAWWTDDWSGCVSR